MVRALCRFDINLVQTVAPGWRQIESEMALDLITIPAVSALVQRALDWTEEQLRGNMRSTPRLFAVKTGFYYRCSSTGTNVVVHLTVGYKSTTGQSDVSSNLDANHSQHGGQDNPTLWGYLSQTLVWTTVQDMQNVNRAWNMVFLYASLLGTGTVQQQNNMIDLLAH